MARKAVWIGIAAGLGAWWAWRQSGAASYQQLTDTVGSVGDTVSDVASTADDWVIQNVGFSIMGRNWLDTLNKPANAEYRAWLLDAEAKNGIPQFMLCRLAFQESAFRQDIITGETVSKAGAMGIMQIIPKWNPGVDPLDPQDAIYYAGKKLAGLFKMFKSWEYALQAYNWGEGNMQKYLSGKIAYLPTETRNYSKQILAGVALAESAMV